MRRATKTMALAAVLLLATPVAFYFAFLQASAQSEVEPLILWEADLGEAVTALAISEDNSTIVVGTTNGTCGSVHVFRKYSADPGEPERSYPATPCAWGPIADLAIDRGPEEGRLLDCGQHVVVGTAAAQPVGGAAVLAKVILLERDVGGLRCGPFDAEEHTYEVQAEVALSGDPSVTSVAIDWAGTRFAAGTTHGSVLFFTTADFKLGAPRAQARYNGPLSEANLQAPTPIGQRDATTTPVTQAVTHVAVGNLANKLARVVAGTSWGEVWVFDAADIVAGQPRVARSHGVSPENRAECAQSEADDASVDQQQDDRCTPVTALDITEDAATPRWIGVGYGHPFGQAKVVMLREDQSGITEGGAQAPPPLPLLGTAVTALGVSDNTVFRSPAGHADLVVGTNLGKALLFRSDSDRVDDEKVTHSWRAENYGSPVLAAAITRDARHIAIADERGIVRMFDANQTQEEETGLASARAGDTGNVWEIRRDAAVTHLAIAGDGTLVAGSAEGSVLLFAAPPRADMRICHGFSLPALDCVVTPTRQLALKKNEYVTLHDLSRSPDVPIQSVSWIVMRSTGGDLRFNQRVAEATGPSFTFQIEKMGVYRFGQIVEDHTGNSMVQDGRVVTPASPGTAPGVYDRFAGDFKAAGTAPQVRLEAEPLIVRVNQNVNFTATATDPDGNVTQYLFVFGNGQSRTVTAPNNTTSFAYATPGVYSAFVRATDDDRQTANSNVVLIRVEAVCTEITCAPTADGEAFLPFSPVRTVQVTPSGAYGVACGGSSGKGGFRWWSLEPAGVTKAFVQRAGEDTTTPVSFCDVSDSGQIAAYGMDNGKVTVQYLGNLTKRTWSPSPATALRGFALSDDGRWLVTCDAKGVVRLFNTDVQDGPREDFDMAPTCRGLASVGDAGSFVVLAGDGRLHLFRRGSVDGGPKDDLAMGDTGGTVDVQHALGGGSRYYGVVGLPNGNVTFFALLGDDLLPNGKNVTRGTALAGPVNVTISENEGGWFVYAGYGSGHVVKFASSSPKNAKGEVLPTATATLPGTGSRAATTLDLSGRFEAPQGFLSARHLIVGAANGQGSKFDTIHDAPRYSFRGRDTPPKAITSVAISDRGLALAGDARCTVGGVQGSCVYLLVEPPTSDFVSGTWNGTAVVPGPVGANRVVTFDAAPTLDGYRAPTSYEWDFDGDTVADATGRFANRTFPTPGSYAVRLTARDGGATVYSDRWVKKVEVLNNPPTACLAVTPPTALTLEDFSFDATCSRDPGGAITQYCWSFGDGSGTCTGGPKIKHKYLDDGVYGARVTVRDNQGLLDTSDVLNVTVLNRVPTAVILVQQSNFQNATDHVDANRDIVFNGTRSSDRDGVILRYVWDFGDGNTANTTQPLTTHRYLATGDYTVRLFVMDDDNATSPTVLRVLHADDSVRIENITLRHDPDPDNRQEQIDLPSTGRLLVQDQNGVNVAGAKCLVGYYYDGPADPHGRPPLEEAPEPYATQTVTTAANGTASFTVAYNDPDGVYVPGRFRILADCGKSGTVFGDAEWHIDAKRLWWIGPPPT